MIDSKGYCARGHKVPDNLLDCPICLKAKWKREMADFQREFLQRAFGGGIKFTIIMAEPRHVLTFAVGLPITFCGIGLENKPPAHRVSYEHYSPEMLSGVCAACRSVIEQALKETKSQ